MNKKDLYLGSRDKLKDTSLCHKQLDFYQSVLLMSEWKGNVRNINENKLMVAEIKKSLKELMEQTQNQSNIVNLKKKTNLKHLTKKQ